MVKTCISSSLCLYFVSPKALDKNVGCFIAVQKELNSGLFVVVQCHNKSISKAEVKRGNALKCLSPLLWTLSTWWVRIRYLGTQGHCDIGVTMVHLLQFPHIYSYQSARKGK